MALGPLGVSSHSGEVWGRRPPAGPRKHGARRPALASGARPRARACWRSRAASRRPWGVSQAVAGAEIWARPARQVCGPRAPGGVLAQAGRPSQDAVGRRDPGRVVFSFCSGDP